MRSNANKSIAEKCFNQYKSGAVLVVSFYTIVALANIISNYQHQHHLYFTIFFSIIASVLFFMVIYAVYRGAFYMNRSVETIEIGDEMINLRTFPATMFLGLVKKESFSVEIPRKLAEFRPSATRHGMGQKYAGEIFSLFYAGDEYLFQSNFFENFSELRRMLEGPFR